MEHGTPTIIAPKTLIRFERKKMLVIDKAHYHKYHEMEKEDEEKFNKWLSTHERLAQYRDYLVLSSRLPLHLGTAAKITPPKMPVGLPR